MKSYCGCNTEPYCFNVCWYHRNPKTVPAVYSNMGICVSFRAVIARGKYPCFILLVESRISITFLPLALTASPDVLVRSLVFIHYSDVITSAIAYHRRLGCLLKRLFKRRSKKTSKLRVTGRCEGNPSETGGFPSQRACDGENISIIR